MSLNSNADPSLSANPSQTPTSQSGVGSKSRGSAPRNDALAKFFNEAELKSRPPSVTICKPKDEVYAFFRDFANAPLFVKALRSVSLTSPKISHWFFEEGGESREVDVEIVREEVGHALVWRLIGPSKATSGPDEHYGIATFETAPGKRGTIVSLHMSGEKTPGKISGVTQYFLGGEPKTRSEINLRRLKAYMETGEVPTVDGQPNGRDDKAHTH